MNRQIYIEQLFNTMGQLRKVLESRAQMIKDEKTATIMQYSALKFLKLNKNSTVSNLAIYLRLSKSSATQLVERLVKVNLVERGPDKNDRRIIHLTITSEGEQKIIELRKKFINKMKKIFSKIPEEDLKELIRIHTNLIEAIREEGK
jgi:DNA-binding MarR family transcriptional regulator